MNNSAFEHELKQLLTMFNINAEQVLYLITSLASKHGSLVVLDEEESHILQLHHEKKFEQVMHEMASDEEYQLMRAEEHLSSMSFDEIMSLPEPKPSVRDSFDDDLPW